MARNFAQADYPLCQGVQKTCLHIQNDSLCGQRMEYSNDGGLSWVYFGLLEPVNRTTTWRREGELWRLRNLSTGDTSVQGRTSGNIMTLRVPGDQPAGFRYGYRA